MSNSFKHKAIVASLAAVFAVGAMTVAQANTFADTTQAAAVTSLTIPQTTTTASTLLTGQTFTLTEATAGAFTADSTGNSLIVLQLTNPASSVVNFQYLPTSNQLKIQAASTVGIAKGTFTLAAAGDLSAAGSRVDIVFNGDTWSFQSPSNNSLTIVKNGVTVASALATSYGGSSDNQPLASTIAAQFNSAYGSGTASATAGVVTAISSRAIFAGGNNAAGQKATPDATVAVNGAAAAAFTATANTDGGSSSVNGTAFNPAITTTTNSGANVQNLNTVTAATADTLVIPVLKNTSGAPATVVVSNISVQSNGINPATAGVDKTVALKVLTASTTAGLSKGASTTLATVAALATTVSVGSPVSIAPGGTVTAGSIVLQENLPASLANGAVVTLTLPSGYNWGNVTNAVVSATSGGGATTVGTLAGNGTNVLTYTVGAAGQSSGFPSKITISGLTIAAPAGASTGTTQNVVVTAAGSVSAATTPYLNIQGGAVATTLNGTAPTVYTFRNYASGINGGAIAAKVNLTETLAGTLLANTSVNVALGDAVAGSTTSGVTTASTGPTFANTTGAAQLSSATPIVANAGYSASGAVFAPSAFSYNISSASTSVLSNVLTLGNLTIGPVAGPVTVGLSSNVIGTLPTVTVANAINATNTSVTAGIPTATLAGPAVTLPTITVTEAAAGALVTQVGGIGQVSFTLTNGTWDVAASQSATWCGAALPASNITGSSSTVLTVNLSSVSTAPCALVLNGKATAALTAAPGAAIAVTVNSTLGDTGQATRQQLQVATIGTTIVVTPPTPDSFPATTTVATATTPTGQVFTPAFTPAAANQGKKADTYVIAYYQGVFLYKKKTPAGCAGWTGFSPQTGGIPQAYETGVTLGTSYQLGNINDCDVTALKGVSYYIGYGVGSSIFGNAQTWNSMLANGTFSNNAVFLTN